MAFNTFFTEMALPFLLVFVTVFAVLQKTKILGVDKKQIDSMAAFVIGLLSVGLPVSRNFMAEFLPWLAVGLAVLLVFFILYGFVIGDLTSLNPKLKNTFGILAGLFTIGVIVYITGLWDTLSSKLNTTTSDWLSIFLIVLVVAAMMWVVLGGNEKTKTPGTPD